MTTHNNNTLIAGCGYIGQRVAKLLSGPVTGIIKSAATEAYLKQGNITPLRADLDNLNSTLSGFNQVFYFAPPPTTGDKDNRIKAFLQHLKPSIEKFVLISTTGVYGDAAGDWIEETTPPHPIADRAKRRYDAEQHLVQWCELHKIQYVILRVPGIYGPNKVPLERLEAGKPIVCQAESGYTNRIHADDLAKLCLHVMMHTTEHSLYNACDGNPSTMWDYFTQLADTFGLARPSELTLAEAEKQLSPGMMSYMRESRRIKNDRVLSLGFQFNYPTLSKGLLHCFVNHSSPD